MTKKFENFVKPSLDFDSPVIFLAVNRVIAKRLRFNMILNNEKNLETHLKLCEVIPDYLNTKEIPEPIGFILYSENAGSSINLIFSYGDSERVEYVCTNLEMVDYFTDRFEESM